MNTKISDRKTKLPFEASEIKRREADLLINNLFKPPKNDTEYFYYTEVISDWVYKK